MSFPVLDVAWKRKETALFYFMILVLMMSRRVRGFLRKWDWKATRYHKLPFSPTHHIHPISVLNSYGPIYVFIFI